LFSSGLRRRISIPDTGTAISQRQQKHCAKNKAYQALQ